MFTQINNNNVKVTKISLEPNQDTGVHLHKLDYIIVPITDGKLKLIDGNNKETFSTLKAGETYFRSAGVKHNVINKTVKNLKDGKPLFPNFSI